MADKDIVERPLWQQVEDIFKKYKYASPAGRMRDELVSLALDRRIEDADTITTLRAEVERLTEERETIFMDIVDERDAAIARAEKAEAAITDLASRAQKILDALNADYSKPTDGDDKWKGGFDDGIKTAASLVHAFASHAFRASLTQGE